VRAMKEFSHPTSDAHAAADIDKALQTLSAAASRPALFHRRTSADTSDSRTRAATVRTWGSSIISR
jgi:hypothetical protein